jgi:GntR family transcriptional regulator
MDITINPKEGLPIYRQIANQIRYMVASGLLEPGEEIPSIRTLALRLKVTPNTVVKAYDELESAGVIEKRHGAGTFVTDGRAPIGQRERQRIIEQRIDALLAEAYQLGISADELSAALKRRRAAIARKPHVEGTDERKCSPDHIPHQSSLPATGASPGAHGRHSWTRLR